MKNLEDRCPYRFECISRVEEDCIASFRSCMVYKFYRQQEKDELIVCEHLEECKLEKTEERCYSPKYRRCTVYIRTKILERGENGK